MRNLKLVSFYGGPGSGKSTLAAGVFSSLKSKGYNCELVTEFAKELIWEGRKRVFEESQAYLFCKTLHKLRMLEGKVDFVVLDSGLLLTLIYVHNELKSFSQWVRDVEKEYISYNILVKRLSPFYIETGRNETEKEALKKDIEVEEMLKEERKEFSLVLGFDLSIDIIVNGLNLIL